MSTATVEVYSQAVNAWIVRTPGRQHPGVVAQGDALHQLFYLSQGVLDRARECSCEDEELVGEAEELRDLLWDRLAQYEAVLRQHGLELPYQRTVEAK